jgi:hypothetical protein
MGIATWLAISWELWPAYGSRITPGTAAMYMMLFGLLPALTVGLVGAMAASSLSKLDLAPRHADFRLSSRWRELVSNTLSRLVFGAWFGLAFGLLGGLIATGIADPASRGTGAAKAVIQSAGLEILVRGLMFGAVFALVFGVVFGLARSTGSSVIAGHSPSPSRSYRGDLRRGIITTLAGVSASCLAYGLAWLAVLAKLTDHSTAGLLFGLAAASAASLAVGGAAVADAWFSFTIATLWHTLQRPRKLPMPWRVMSALEDCHRLGLLRTVGPLYQFRHTQLQDHLAPPRPAPTG